MNSQLSARLSMTGLPNQTIISTEKRGVRNIFHLLGFGTLVKLGFRASNAFLCSGKQCYALYFLKLGWRRKYPCSPWAWCHSPLTQEAGNLARILSIRGLDSRIPTSQKSPVTTRLVLLGEINLHPSCWRWVRVSSNRSSQRSKRRVNKKTPDAVLSWGGHAVGEMGYSLQPKRLGPQRRGPAAAVHWEPSFPVQRTDSKAEAFQSQTL